MSTSGRHSYASIWLVLILLFTGCEHYKPSPETVGGLSNDPLKALTTARELIENINSHHSGVGFSWTGTKVPDVFVVTGEALTITCFNQTPRIYPHRLARDIEVNETETNRSNVMHWNDGADHSLAFHGFPTAIKYADALYLLAQPRLRQEPSADTLFLDAVKRYRADQQRYAENTRRVQVQVESALKAHNTIAAAMLYRDALTTAAGWPEGHFNLALLYGELEFYPDAINEMKRYLYLVPNAPDARAAQDKIYEWEGNAK